MTIRISLDHVGNKTDHRSADAVVELNEDRFIGLGFELNAWEERDYFRAQDFPKLERRVAEVEAAIVAHRAATVPTVEGEHGERINVAAFGDAVATEADLELWRVLPEPNPDGQANTSRGVSDFDRILDPDEARELAAVLLHYANEAERPR